MIPHQQLELEFEGLKLIRGGRYPNWRDRPDWLIEGLWPHAGVGMVTASEKVGKTWLMITVGLSIASGLPFLGKYPVRQGPVLLYSPEGDRKDLEDRIDQVAWRMGINPLQVDFYTAEMNGLCLDSEAHQDTIRAAIQGTGARLVIFDPLRDCMEGQLSNNDDATIVTKFLLSIQRQFNCGGMISHHENLDGKMMGARAWSAFADALWYLKEEDGIIRFSNTQRKERTVEDFWIVRNKHEGRVGVEITRAMQQSKELDDHILEFLQSLPSGEGATVRQIRECLRENGVHAANDRMSVAINRLKSHKAILQTPPYGYRLATEADFEENGSENRSVRNPPLENERTGTEGNLSGPGKSEGDPPGRTAFSGENASESGKSEAVHLSGNDFRDSEEPARVLVAREVDFLPQPEPGQGYPWIGVDLGRPTPEPVSFWWQSFALMEHLEEAGFDTTDIHGMAEFETPPCKGGRGDSPSSGA